jgi:AAA-like domain
MVSLIYQITETFNLSDAGGTLRERFDLIEWWESMRLLPPVHRFSEFIKTILLTELRQERIVIFIDEIDSILNLNFNTDNFFATIRYFYNERANYPELNRITFVLLGVASPSRLIKDNNRTPFNIGQAINLSGFSLDEVEPLIRGLKDKCDNPMALIKEILAWTGGQPLLTQRICQLIIDSDNFIAQGSETKQVQSLVQTEVIDKWSYQDSQEHFKSIRSRLLDTHLSPVRLLQMYQQILQTGEILVDDSEEVTELLLSGLVRNCEGKLKVYNRIYQSVFDESWIEQTSTKISSSRSI